MKHAIFLFGLLLVFNFSQAQLGSIIKDKVKNKVNTDVGNETDKTLDKIDPLNQDNSDNSSNQDQTNSDSQKKDQPTNNTTASATSQPVSVTSYQNYDFRAGDKIIFEDNFASDADGEFPAHWDLIKGQAVVNKITGIPSFLLTDGNYCEVKPLMKTTSYLTDNFSIEYDIYMTPGAYGLVIYMMDAENQDMSVQVTGSEALWSLSNTKSFSGDLPTAIRYEAFFNKWHHVAIAFKNDQLKVYVDQYRVLTVPHCGLHPATIECAGIGNQNDPIIFKDLKIADGASMNMLDAIMTNGKFITHGIHFDVNSANIKPESMGVIGDISKYMKDHADLKIEVDGHTDSDGDDASNLKLSQARADAVKAALVQAGIDASRLSTKGLGEAKPMSVNTTPEGKAENRRVEFVKI